MNSIWHPARPGRSGAVAKTTTRRRFAAGSFVLAAVVASLALTTGTAHASATPYCLDANAQQIHNFGGIIQFQCNDNDPYQNWTHDQQYAPAGDPAPPAGDILVQLRNDGAGDCLDADDQEIYDGGLISQLQCNVSDPFQLWMPVAGDNGVAFENYGAWLYGEADCLDANAQQTYNYGTVAQWACSASDPYQAWTDQPTDNYVWQNVGASA
jgi:hypothetical protein